MSKQARIINFVAVDVVDGDPFEFFHPSIAAEFVAVPDDVQSGWVFNGENWTAPDVQPSPVVDSEPIKVSPVEFKLLFTSPERIAIQSARATDPIIEDFFSLIEDVRLTHVNLSLQSTQDALSYLVAVGLLTVDRRAAILTGVLL